MDKDTFIYEFCNFMEIYIFQLQQRIYEALEQMTSSPATVYSMVAESGRRRNVLRLRRTETLEDMPLSYATEVSVCSEGNPPTR